MDEETTAAHAPHKPYKAFISYSHAADDLLAPTLQSALQSFAKPWYRLRAVRVFRDRTNLSVQPDLWGSIEEAVRRSEFFLLLASPEAARSPWVPREIEAFLSANTSDRLLIVLTGGRLAWDEGAKDFAHDVESAFPKLGRSIFARVPKWEDLSWARGEENLSLRNPAFRDVVASISSTIRDISLDEITGRDVIEHKRTKRITRLVVAALVFLLACVAAAALVAYRQAGVANARRIAAESALLSSREPNLLGVSALLAAEALKRSPSIEAQETLASALQLLPRSAAVVRGRGPVSAVAFTPDGKHLVTGSWDGRLLVNKAEGGALVAELDLKSPVEAVTLGPDEFSVAAVTPEGEVTVWRWADAGAAPLKIKPELRVTAHAFGRDGRFFAAAEGGAVNVYYLGSGARVATIIPEFGGGITAVGFSGRGEYLALGNSFGEVSLWSMWATGSPQQEKSLKLDGEVSKIAFDKDAQHVACATHRRAFYVWNVADGTEVAKAHTDFQIDNIAYNADGDYLAVWGTDATAHMWSVSEGVTEQVQLVSRGRVNAVAFRPDSGMNFERYVATASNDGTARLWDYSVSSTRQMSRERMRVAHGGPVSAVAFSPDGSLIATAGDDGKVQVWYLRDTPSLVQFQHPRSSRLSVAFREGQDALLTAGDEGALYAWSLDGVKVDERQFGLSYRKDVALSPDGSRIATVDGNLLFINDTSSRKEMRPVELLARVERLSFGYGGRYLALALVREQSPFKAEVYNIVLELEGANCRKLEGVKSSICGMQLPTVHGMYGEAVSSKGRYVARLMEWYASGRPLGRAGSWVLVQDVRAERDERGYRAVLDQKIDAHINAVSFSPDESLMAVGVGNTVELHELPSGRVVARMQHRETVDAIAFSARGEYVASTGADATLRVWSVPDGTELSRTQMPWSASQVVFSASGKYLATFSDVGAAHVWLWRPEDLMAEAAARLPANLSREEWRRYVGEEPYTKTFLNLPVPDE
jgi:WD40 repeat protein